MGGTDGEAITEGRCRDGAKEKREEERKREEGKEKEREGQSVGDGLCIQYLANLRGWLNALPGQVRPTYSTKPRSSVKEITRHLARWLGREQVGRWGRVADGSARGGLDKIRASELPVGRRLELLRSVGEYSVPKCKGLCLSCRYNLVRDEKATWSSPRETRTLRASHLQRTPASSSRTSGTLYLESRGHDPPGDPPADCPCRCYRPDILLK